ncbi:polysaccharide biosynthesis/export family protein [Loktanella atrilutea]|uniref:polysaccharide biosynthesis/export family protein n=1 Tax=Loktanella atrilutea TaxID=366533 RepID=UPI000932996B|nr:polysaccharide biosynthesis/export family protein [Loktanella atrilutea]
MIVPPIPTFCRQLGGTLVALCLATLPALAETPVARGDVLYVAVTGAPEMTRDCPVDVDGRIRLPLVGGISVAGLSLDAIQTRVAETLVARDILRDPVVLVEVSQYRAVYVGGLVKTSGEVPFRPGLTVRQAIIAAGGIATSEEAASTGLGDIIELLARQRASTAELMATDSEIARLRAELSDAAPPPAPVNATPAGDDDGLPRIEDLDSAQLHDVIAGRANDRAYADTALTLTAVELDVLDQLAKHQTDAQADQHAEVEAMRDLVARGVAPRPRLQELEREESRLARDLLENQTFAARARQNQETIRHQTEADLTARRIATREALRKALGARTEQVAALEALQGRLLAAGRAPEDAPADRIVPVVQIFRAAGAEPQALPATMDTEINPGDVVDVSLPLSGPRG